MAGGQFIYSTCKEKVNEAFGRREESLAVPEFGQFFSDIISDSVCTIQNLGGILVFFF